jgi:glycosyltransferase involved in cell wall biosynthesis
MAVSIVLPCYNPIPDWEQIVYSNYCSFFNDLHEPLELIIVLDGKSLSITQDTLVFLERNIPTLKVVDYPINRGKGYAIRQGVAVATGEVIIYTDVDFPYTPDSMRDIYKTLKNDECDVAVGVKNSAYYAHVPLIRRIISRYLRLFIRLFLSMPITDTQCGLKGFRQSVAPLFLQTTIDRYLFDLEFIRNCFKSKKYRVKAVPVTLNENVHFRKMNYRILFPEMVNFIKLLMSNKQ